VRKWMTLQCDLLENEGGRCERGGKGLVFACLLQMARVRRWRRPKEAAGTKEAGEVERCDDATVL